jgi:hypothetical protein
MRTMEKVARGALTKRVMPDRSKIAVTSDNEVKYWTKHFGVTARIWNAPSIEWAIPPQAFGKSYESPLILNNI